MLIYPSSLVPCMSNWYAKELYQEETNKKKNVFFKLFDKILPKLCVFHLCNLYLHTYNACIYKIIVIIRETNSNGAINIHRCQHRDF